MYETYCNMVAKWTINEQDKKKLEAMEMWTWRRLLKVSWTEMKSNIDILNQVEEP